MAIAIFFNSLGGSLSISIAQNVFIQGLRNNIPKHTTGIDVEQIITSGATRVTSNVLPNERAGLLFGYNQAIVDTFRFAIAAAGIALFVSIFVSVVELY